MFRFTESEEDCKTVFVIEGRLAGPAVPALGEFLRSLEEQGRPIPALVDLMGVTAIDAAGKGLLRQLHAQGATLRAKGCLNRAIVEEITSSTHAAASPGGRSRGEGSAAETTGGGK